MNRTPKPPTRQGGGVSVWCPENLDVGRLLKTWGRRVGEGVLFLGHCVYTSLANDARCRDTGRVPLKTNYLRSVIGRHHLDVVRHAALEAGYVDRDRSYRPGYRSKEYWILPQYESAQPVQRRITDAALRDNIRGWRESRERAMWERIRANQTPVDAAVCSHLWQNLQKLRIDADIDPARLSKPAHLVAVENLRHGDLWFSVDPYGRIHSNLTNLRRVLRPYLSVDGRRLVNIDTGESQPLFFGIALAEAKSGREAANQTGRQGNQQGRRQRGSQHHMLDNTMLDNRSSLAGGFNRARLPADLRRYLELCEGRAFYTSCGQECPVVE